MVFVIPIGTSDTDDVNSAADSSRSSCDLCSRERVVIGKRHVRVVLQHSLLDIFDDHGVI